MVKTITIFEHEALYLSRGVQRLSPDDLKALQSFHKEKNFPFYNLIHDGVRFCEYVGVIQIGKLTIEVLPKADRLHDRAHWRNLLIDMLKSSGVFDTKAPSSAQLKLKSNSILDHYFELFVTEVELLLHNGLIKRYRKIQKNTFALKGKLLFNKHISANIVHKERFYVQHMTYDTEHLLNQILLKTINLLRNNNLKQTLSSRINNLYLNFPELKGIKVTDDTFDRITYDRKNQGYHNAIEIAKLLLLNYHPDINSGKRNVLALMFDMNFLWERFVLRALQKFNPDNLVVRGQSSKRFWKSDGGKFRTMRPDIVIEGKQPYILDTKWKNLSHTAVADDDLRQMYTYSKYHDNARVYLVYPGEESKLIEGRFINESNNNIESANHCGIIRIMLQSGDNKGQGKLSNEILALIKIIK